MPGVLSTVIATPLQVQVFLKLSKDRLNRCEVI